MDQKEEIDDIPKDKLNEFFDLLEKLPTVSPKRNDLCLCGSGKKYKKCCLEKNSNPFPASEVRMESFQIKYDGLTPQESKNNFPPPSKKDEKLLALLFHNLREHPEEIDSENCDYFRQLNTLRSKYPDNPIILNYIANGYQHLDLQDKMDEIVVKTYEKFPNYLFALTAQANLYLRDGFPQKALEVLKGAFTLKKLYPHRDVFHITEVRAFEYLMVRYFCAIKDFNQAEIHFQMMKAVLDKDDVILQSAQKLIKRVKRLYNFKAGILRFLKSEDKYTQDSLNTEPF